MTEPKIIKKHNKLSIPSSAFQLEDEFKSELLSMTRKLSNRPIWENNKSNCTSAHTNYTNNTLSSIKDTNTVFYINSQNLYM